jgi:hypothetical protein
MRKREFQVIVFSTIVGLTAALAVIASADIAIRRAGLAWRGQIFTNEEFNWKDSRIYYLGLVAYAFGTVPTAMIMRSKQREHK